MNSGLSTIGLRGIATRLGEQIIGVEELARNRRLTSDPAALVELGFNHAHICLTFDDALRMAVNSAEDALADARLEPEDIDLLIWASARPESHVVGGVNPDDFMTSFRYCSGWLQNELGLTNASTMAVAQQGCASMFSAMRIARNAIGCEERVRNVLCVGMDILPPGSRREVLYNVISDAACALVLSENESRDKWIGYNQISKGFYWDPVASEAEIVAAYFPTSKLLIDALLAKCELTPDQIDLVIPTGVVRTSWKILLELTGIPDDHLYDDGAPFGHTIIADNFIYLERARQSGGIPQGAKLLLFTYGFGSSWCGLVLEH